MLFNFFKSKQPQAGAEAWSFETAFNNPLYNVAYGPGAPVLEAISAIQPPQVYYPSALSTVTGLGGLIYGTLYAQPLYVPPGTTFNPNA